MRYICVLLASATLMGCDTAPIAEAKDAVRAKMLDPDATQFRDIEQCHNDKTVIRGEVNGKNAYGAYAGFKMFYYSNGRVLISAPGDEAEWRKFAVRCFSAEIIKEAEATITRIDAEIAASAAAAE